MKAKWITWAILAISLIAAIVGYAVLPETVTMQITADGQPGNTMPKLLGLLIPFAISCVFATVYYRTRSGKYLLVSAVGLLCYVFVFVVNL